MAEAQIMQNNADAISILKNEKFGYPKARHTFWRTKSLPDSLGLVFFFLEHITLSNNIIVLSKMNMKIN